MNLISKNLKHLRGSKKLSQEQLAEDLKITRARLGGYEESRNEPPIEILIRVSDYFKIAVDTLIKVDLGRLSESQLKELGSGHDAFIKGTKLRVLATTVDSDNRENIELVPIKARAGYTAGYNDPEFIRGLPTFQLPFLSSDRKYRTFQIEGDSMLPIPDKSYVTGEYVINWNEIKDGNAYIILTKEDGIVFKVAYNQIRTKKKLLLRSLNHIYKPYEVNVADVQEIWKLVYYTSPELPEPVIEKDELVKTVADLKQDVYKLISKVEIALVK